MSPDQQFIDEIRKRLDLIKYKYDLLAEKYPNADLRPTFLSLPSNVLFYCYLHLQSADDTITKPDWWQSKLNKNISEKAVKDMVALLKLQFFSFFFSKIETCQRKTMNIVSPGYYTGINQPYKQIYEKYLVTLNILAVDLFNISRNIRNSLHSNGVFLSKNGKNELLHWKGVNFDFVHQQPINFMSTGNILFLVDELFIVIDLILDSEELNRVPFIEDKYH